MNDINRELNAVHAVLTGISLLIVAFVSLYGLGFIANLLAFSFLIGVQLTYFIIGSRKYITQYSKVDDVSNKEIIRSWKLSTSITTDFTEKLVFRHKKYRNSEGVVQLNASVSDKNIQIYTQPLMPRMNVNLFTIDNFVNIETYKGENNYNLLITNDGSKMDWQSNFDGILCFEDGYIHLHIKTKWLSVKSKRLQSVYRVWGKIVASEFELPLDFNSKYIMNYFKEIAKKL
jgi:hypothetical protein